MKNLIIYSGIALVLLLNMYRKSFTVTKREAAQEFNKAVAKKDFKTLLGNEKSISQEKGTRMPTVIKLKSKTLCLKSFPKLAINITVGGDEPIAVVSKNIMNKTADELIAEDNVITENNISNETQALDFDIINDNTIGYEWVEPIDISTTEKSADQIIAEDNVITENNISNETQALDFDIINSNTIGYEYVEPINIPKTEKSADQLIEEDNVITENNISNETQALDFEIIDTIATNRN